MAAKPRNNDAPSTMRGVGESRYARSYGVGAYRSRRRRSMTVRVVVALALLAVLGGAALLFGRQYFDYSGIFSKIPAPTAKQYAEEKKVEEAEAASPTYSPVDLRLIVTGDVVLNSTVAQSGYTDSGTYDFNHIFAHISQEVQEFDIRAVNQEGAMGGSNYGYGNDWPLNSPQELGRAEVNAGFNVILRANDHTLDTGRDGIHNELLWWHNEHPEMPVLGIAEPDPEANPALGDYVSNVYVYEKDGFKVAILNHTWNIGEDEQGVVSALVSDKITQDVAKAREQGAQMIVACPHWGLENSAEIVEEESTFARLYADQGVDVIIGSHPRVLQRTEILEGPEGHQTVCFYSLGCLISSGDAQNLLGGLAEVSLHRAEDGTCTVSSAVLKPTITHRSNGSEYTTYLVSDYNDDLAYSSWDGYLTREELARRCTEALGEGYNADACELRVV